MIPFLQQIAALFYQRYGIDIQRFAFVFPNRRSGLFFRKYLSQVARKPLFAPAVFTINELFLRMSDKQPADRIRMLFLLYRIYIRHSRSDEGFDDFVFWGEMLLNDFEDIDKYLIDAARLFSNVADLQQIDNDMSYLQPEQIEAIRTFWSSFQPKGNGENVGSRGNGENRGNFLKIWEHLYAIYKDFRKELAEEGRGYEGMIFRDVAEKMKQGALDMLPYEKIVFVGLNAISTAEKELMKGLQKQGIADFYWDCGSESLLDVDNKASFFIRENLKLFPSAFPLPEEEPNRPEIKLIGIPSRIGQAKQVYSILKETLAGRSEPDSEEALRTAIVLPDEQLLIPVLHSIPEEFTRINVTLGYSLSGAPIASLIDSIMELQKRLRTIDGRLFFYHREVLAVLNHHYIVSACPDEISVLLKEITEQNRIFLSSSDLNRSPLLEMIFQPVTGVSEISDYLILILKELNRIITSHYDKPEKDETEAVSMGEFEQEFVYHYFTMINRLKEMIHDCNIQLSVETFFRLLKRLTDTISIPFQGRPLSGLQIMGMLETRVLDFDRLIILSMNEGIFPAKQTAGSFIPYNLRRGFGLPTYEHQDSIWAYHFYRLIARAKKVALLYDTRTEGMQTGEVSRFVHQLRYHYGIPVKNKPVVFNISSSQPLTLQVEKTEEVMSKMKAYLTGGSKALSASTINTYLDCPLKFYFSSIEGLKEEEEVSESVENKVFGNIFHRVLEWLYQPFIGSVVTADLLKLQANEKTLTEAIHRAFSELFFHSKEVRSLSGQHYLTGEMIRKYVLKLIEKDCELTPFKYIQSEQKIQYPIRLTNGTEIQLKGFIDRLDEVNGVVRVVDYKTGTKKKLEFKSMASLFDMADEKRQSAIMQVFMYAWMCNTSPYPLRRGTDRAYPPPEGAGGGVCASQNNIFSSDASIQPTLYYVRDFFSNDFDPVIYHGKEKEPVSDFSVYRDEFENCLRSCLDRMFDPDIPFTQAVNTKICTYCPFSIVCGKN